jgi:hypothetical protein
MNRKKLKRLTRDIVNDRLFDRGIQLISEFITTKHKSSFQCNKGHEWDANVASVLKERGCPHCAGLSKLSKEIINQRLSEQGRKTRMIGDYTNKNTKTDFMGECGHIFSAVPNNVFRGSDCPLCCKYGFQINKPGYIYILNFGDYIKYGISNNLEKRLREHLNNGQYTLVLSKLYEDGSIAFEWERNIKKIFGGRYVTKEIMPDGHSETLSPDKLEALLDTIR